jgi:hypothetical protein
MAAIRNIFLTFVTMTVTNKPFGLGVWNLLRQYVVYVPTRCIWSTIWKLRIASSDQSDLQRSV